MLFFKYNIYVLYYSSYILLQFVYINSQIVGIDIQLKSNVYIHLAECAKLFIFFQVRGIIQNACYCLFNTDLNKIIHIKDVYM